jgi:VanZ family protein
MFLLVSPDRWRQVKVWIPPVAWAALIFVFSEQAFSGANTSRILQPLLRYLLPPISASDIEIVHLLLRKVGHFVEYFILAALITRALCQPTPHELSARHLALAVALAALYAISDEWHQALVPNRSASGVDVLIDVFGAICGISWFRLRNPGK